MEGRRQIQQESAAQYILEHLFNTGSVYHKELMLIFGNTRNKQAAWRVLRELELNNLVEIGKGLSKDIRRISLTNDGLSMLQTLDDYYNLFEYLKVPRWSIKDTKAEKESQIKTMMVGTEILCYPRDKPDLLTAAKIINEKTVSDDTDILEGYWYAESINQFSEKFGVGIYYSPAEVRDAFRVNIGAEQIYRSRFNGIIITPDRLYILYHVQEGLIKINKPSERVLIESLQTMFYDYPQYFTPSCIAIGNIPVEIGIPTLVTGFKGGMITNRDSLNNITAQEAMNFLKANIKLFSEVFYVPISETGIGILNSIISTTIEEREDEIAEWFNSTSGYVRQGNKHTGIYIEKDYIVEHVAYTELKKILEIRNSSDPVRIVTIPILAQGIAQAVGPKAIDFVDLENNEIVTDKYDIYGFVKGAIKIELTKPKTIKESVSKSVHCRVPMQVYYLLQQDAENENISVPQKINQILKSHYSD